MKDFIKGIIYKNIYSIIFETKKYDNIFWDTYNFSLKSKNWSYDKLRRYQLYQLKKLVIFAYENTKYYKKLFDEYGFNPYTIRSFKEINKLPILTKEDIKANYKDLIAMPNRKLEYLTTGGSTGMPMGFYVEKNVTYNKINGFVWRSYNEGDYYFGDKIATLRGNVTGKENFKYSEEAHELLLSSFHLTEENMKKYLELMEKYKVKHIRAYPSAAEILANYILKNNIEFNSKGRIKTLFTSSETLSTEQRKLIEKSMNLKVVDHYGNSEGSVIISQCKCGHYHEYMEYGYTEYLNEEGKHINDGQARVITTGFSNYAMPLIRYDTGDIAELIKGQKCDCGMEHRVVNRIVGRWKSENLIVGTEGNLISLSALNTHTGIFDNVYRIQYVQKEIGKMILNIMPNDKYTDKDRKRIYEEYKLKFGDDVEFILNETDEFEYTQRGKFKLLVQELDINKFLNKKV